MCPVAVLNYVFPILHSIQKKLHQSLSEHISRCFHFLYQSKTLSGTSALLWFQRKDAHVLSREKLWNAPVRSLMMKQSGFPVILKHVLHLSVYIGRVKESLHLHPVWNCHFGNGWIPSVSFLTFIHLLLPKLPKLCIVKLFCSPS